MTKVSNTIYNTGEWPQDFTEAAIIALKKKTKAKKCSDYRTISLIAHTAKIIAKYSEEGLKTKLRMCLEKISLDLEEGKELGMQSG